MFGPGRRGRRGGDWMRVLGLDLTNPVGTGLHGRLTKKTVNITPLIGQEVSTQFAL